VTHSNLVRTHNWNKRTFLCREHGWRYGLVFVTNRACMHRLKIKTWATTKLGPPACVMYYSATKELHNTSSDWFCGFINGRRKNTDPYYIVFKEKKYRDFALYL
jgi:hypothetical protein